MTSVNNWKIGDEVLLPAELGAADGIVKWVGHTSSMTVMGTRVAGTTSIFRANVYQEPSSPGVYVHNTAMIGVEVKIPFPGAAPRSYVILVPAALLRRPKCEHCDGSGLRGARG